MQQETIIEVMQPKGCEVVFRNLSFSVEIKNKKKKRFETKTILEDVSGVFRAGRLTAVMGASGAGKTSLLQVLAGQLHVGQLSGEVLLNNEPVIGMGMKKISGFVFQDDVILSTMTVHEAVSMSATLRLSKKTTAEEKAKKVANVIKLLNLEKCQNTIIGDDSKKGISGGERKRCAMAMEIITNPAILFLDEPTSGLDTFTAHSCVAILKNLAASGNTIVSTIHQPSSDIYHMFDDLLLLSEGRVMYQGPCEDAVSYFSRLNFICPQYCNPADYLFMSILNNEDQSKDGSSDKEKESNKDRLERLLAYWAGSEENKKILLITANPATGGVSKSSYKEKSAFITQFGYLAGRASKNAFRNPFIFRSKLAQYVIISLIIGLLYLRLNLRTDTSASTNRTGVLFFVAVNNVMQNAIGVLSIFGLEKAVFRRENGAGYYSLSAYFLTKVMVEIPFQILFPWMGATMIYWMVGLQATVAKYFICMLFAVLCSISGFGMGIFFASVFANIPTALAVAPLVLLPFMLFSGLFATSDSIPPYFDWIKYISPMKYGFEGMFKNEFTGLSLPSPDGRKNIDGTPVFLDGSVFIKNIGLDDGISIELCAILLFVIAFFCILSGYLALSYIVYKQGRPITLSKKESKGRIMPGVAVESKAK